MSEPKSILIVEDDEDVVRGLMLRLESAGYRTRAVGCADRGVEIARNELPDAIVMDVRLHERSGLDALDDLKKTPSTAKIPVVMISGCVNSQSLALEKGADFFLRKPYRGRDVLQAVESAMAVPQCTSARE